MNTDSKLFCSDSQDHRGKRPNENTCPICLGFPGSKPKISKKAIEHGMTIALALNCNISRTMFFSRKTYFYPDMSKNYQITQYEVPLATEGLLSVGDLKIRIRRVHIEEDPARLVHVGGDITNSEYTLMDYNRSGVPLAEIVTEPDFTSPKQTRAFLEKLMNMLEHTGVYDPGKEATIRVDANVSIDGGERVEVKNITGFENVEKALNYEIIRQNSLKRSQMKIARETRHFDATTSTTKSLRKKEYEDDYGYIFDPDLPMVRIDDEWLAKIKRLMPELPDQRVARFVSQYGLTEYYAGVIVYTDKRFADFYEECCRSNGHPDIVAKWAVNYLLKSLNWRSEKISDSKVTPKGFVEFLALIENGKLNERFAKELIKEYVDTGVSPGELLYKTKLNISEEDLRDIIAKVLKENGRAIEDYRSGRKESLQFLIGLVLKETKKQSNPNEISKLLTEMMPR